MRRSFGLTLLLVALLSAPAGEAGASTCSPDGLQASGSIYRICMPPPELYNGMLVLWAHGFQDAGTPVQIPEDQLSVGSTSLPELINGLGFAFATNSYSKTGLAVRQGMADLLDLVEIFAAEQGAPAKVFLTGASEGGIITALLAEQHPEVFAGGVAACGPVGSFPLQIAYFGDARALFQVYFPGLIPGDPFAPPTDLVSQWSTFYDQQVRPVVFALGNRPRLLEYARVAQLPFDDEDVVGSLEISVRDVLRSSVVNLTDAAETLGGFPYGNAGRWYRGSSNDLLLNALVPRARPDPAALAEMKAFYETSGVLQVPLITLHTLQDQQVPYWHEVLYQLKTLASGSFLKRHLNIPIDRFEHCNFTATEVLTSFAALLAYTGDLDALFAPAPLPPAPAPEALEAVARPTSSLAAPFDAASP
jgi:pimeloyl-ACP methyl ester carboxylesterase